MKNVFIASLFLILDFQYVKCEYVDCSLPNDYDYTYDYPEVVYLPPEQVRNIIEFLNKYSSSMPGIATQKTTEEATTVTIRQREETTPPTVTIRQREETTPTTVTIRQREETTPTTVTIRQREETTPITEPTISFTEATAPHRDEIKGPNPIEDVNNDRLSDREEDSTSTVATSRINLEILSTPSTEQKKNIDSNEYDNVYERDSEEDILSVKKKPEIMLEQASPSLSLDYENNSKPKNIYNWLKF